MGDHRDGPIMGVLMKRGPMRRGTSEFKQCSGGLMNRWINEKGTNEMGDQ